MSFSVWMSLDRKISYSGIFPHWGKCPLCQICLVCKFSRRIKWDIIVRLQIHINVYCVLMIMYFSLSLLWIYANTHLYEALFGGLGIKKQINICCLSSLWPWIFATTRRVGLVVSEIYLFEYCFTSLFYLRVLEKNFFLKKNPLAHQASITGLALVWWRVSL